MRKVPGLSVPGYAVLQLALGQSSVFTRGDGFVYTSGVDLPWYCFSSRATEKIIPNVIYSA